MTIEQKHTNNTQYFLVGAMFSGTEDQYERFIQEGIWESGWGPNHLATRTALESMQIGDRIAIKKGFGSTTSNICIRAIGIVTEIHIEDGLVSVDWKNTGMNRMVHSHGCYSTIHGPYTKEPSAEIRSWINDIFCL